MSVLAIRSLSKAFGGVRAVNEVSFEIGAGEFLAMIGPNGAGKSTCFNMINGQLAPDSGEILFDGKDIAGLAPREIWRLGVGRTFQVAATFHSMTVVENVQMALISHARRDLRAVAAGGVAASRARARTAGAGRHARSRRPAEPRARLWRRQARRARHRARQRAAAAADGRADRRHGAARAQRTDRAGQAAGGRARHFGAVHRAFDGRGVRLRRPHHRAGARPADRRRRRSRDPRQRAGARSLFRHRQDFRAERTP